MFRSLSTAVSAPVTGEDEDRSLSVRQLEVATLAANAFSNSAIAAAVFVSVATV
jgi:DNA-binding NarL/FixJ family response regulator